MPKGAPQWLVNLVCSLVPPEQMVCTTRVRDQLKSETGGSREANQTINAAVCAGRLVRIETQNRAWLARPAVLARLPA